MTAEVEDEIAASKMAEGLNSQLNQVLTRLIVLEN